jgi:hypothetical protein
MTHGEIGFKLDSMARSIDSLVLIRPSLDVAPHYCLGGLSLAVASLGEHMVNRGLELHEAASRHRPSGHAAAGLLPPDVLRYVHTLITTGREPGAEVGRWT